jgi:predicted kinase
MKGLPGSGKSTIAQGKMLADGNIVRINKDLLRKMLHFNKFTGVNEGLTRDAARDLVKLFIGKGTNVLIDDTNLNLGTMQSWQDLAKELNAKVEIMDLTDVPIEECILRDSRREEQVGAIVIKNMAIRSGIKKFEPDSVVICDIDGTISDPSARLHYVNEENYKKRVKKKEIEKREWKKDWNAFFSEIELDPIRPDTQKILIKNYNEGKTIIFLSARPERFQDGTLRWLQQNYLTFAYTLIMRKNNDKRPDVDVKREIFNTYFPDKGVVHAIYDDRPSIIRLWQELGLNVIDCGSGKEF